MNLHDIEGDDMTIYKKVIIPMWLHTNTMITEMIYLEVEVCRLKYPSEIINEAIQEQEELERLLKK